MSADVNRIGVGLGDAARDVADAGLRDELHRNARVRSGSAQIVNQLREIFN